VGVRVVHNRTVTNDKKSGAGVPPELCLLLAWRSAWYMWLWTINTYCRSAKEMDHLGPSVVGKIPETALRFPVFFAHKQKTQVFQYLAKLQYPYAPWKR
jgi:hypothetical protein